MHNLSDMTSIEELMLHYTEIVAPRDALLHIREDALWHHDNLIDGLAFIGILLEQYGSTKRKGCIELNGEELEQYGRFINTALSLIRAMDNCIAAYDLMETQSS